MESKETLQQLLIDSAVHTVAQNGLDRTTTKLIAQNADLNEAYIYRCFKNKDDLLAEAFYAKDQLLVNHVIKLLQVTKKSGLSWKERCFLLWRSGWNFIMDRSEEYTFYLRYYYSANCRKYAYDRHLDTHKPLADKIRFAFKPGANVELLLHQIFDTMFSFAARVQSGEIVNCPESVEQMFHQIFSFVSINATRKFYNPL